MFDVILQGSEKFSLLKKTVVICWWESKTQKIGTRQVDKETDYHYKKIKKLTF